MTLNEYFCQQRSSIWSDLQPTVPDMQGNELFSIAVAHCKSGRLKHSNGQQRLELLEELKKCWCGLQVMEDEHELSIHYLSNAAKLAVRQDG